MKVERDETTYTSWFGTLATILVAFFLAGFAFAKVQTLIKRKDVDIIESKQDNAFEDYEQFSSKNNDFFLAAAITNYNSNRTITESKEYGELLIEHYGWGNSELGYAYGSHALDNHWCTDEELGYDRTN